MGRELAEPDWAALTDAEVSEVFGATSAVAWRSPRPMSAAALVRRGTTTVFVKRHHLSVRNPVQLVAEHRFAAHLRSRGQPVPAVLRLASGQSVMRRGEFCYEAYQLADGVDLYRDAVSWSPYASGEHARAAGAALAALHLAAADFALPARPPAVLMNSCRIICADDPLAEITHLIAGRPDLAAYLAGRRWWQEYATVLAPLIALAAPRLRALPGQWGHGDWHPSNLTWASSGEAPGAPGAPTAPATPGVAPGARVAGVFDFGLANRTSAVHDLAIALERSVVTWLDLAETGTASADLDAAAALLDGYQAVRPLSEAEAAALPRVLPVIHLEYALSEVDYFTAVARSPANADLAQEYLIGHARWFGQPQGAALLKFLRRYPRASSAGG